MRTFSSRTIPTDIQQMSVSPKDALFRRFQAARTVRIRSFVLFAILAACIAPASRAQGVVPDGSVPPTASVAKKVVVNGVVQDHTFTPLSGIEVLLTTDAGQIYSTRSSSKGKFRFKVVTTDDYTVHGKRGEEMTQWPPQNERVLSTKSGEPSRWHTLMFNDPTLESAPAPAPELPPAVVVEPGYHIHGTVLEADGSPAKGVEMKISSGLGKFFKLPIDENGRFSFRSEGDESFWIHPIQTIGNATTSHGGKKVTPAIAQAWGEEGLIFTLPPAEGQDDWYADNGYVMVGMADQESDQEEVVDTLAQPNKANASAPLKLEVFPNLDLGTMDLNLNVPVNTKLMMRFIGPDGQEIYSQEFVFGPYRSVFLPIGRRPAGVYTIELRDARGQTVSQQLHVK